MTLSGLLSALVVWCAWSLLTLAAVLLAGRRVRRG